MLDNMWNKTNAFLLACAMLALSAAPAAAQQAQPQGPYGPGPWWADGYAWSFWWICPLMMLVMFGIMGVIMLARHHRGDGHWTPPWPAPRPHDPRRRGA